MVRSAKPELSVILTSKDRWPLLKEAVDSVLSQDIEDLQLIIVDDSADRRVSNYLKDLDKDLRVDILSVKFEDEFRATHKMVGVMVNHGLNVAFGKYVSYLCDDDVYLPGRCRRMIEVLDAGEADMVVDKTQWMTHDSSDVHPQEWLGNYGYPRPLEKGHWELLEAIKGNGSNFICHDSVMYRNHPARWPTDLEGKTPVDWRFWLKLHAGGFRVKTIDVVGELAYVPGTWRHAGVTDAIKHRNLGMEGEREMEKLMYAKNMTSQIQVLPFDQGLVKPGGRILASKVMTPDGKMFPGFSYDSNVEVPTLDTMPKNNGALPPIPDIKELLVTTSVKEEEEEKEEEEKEEEEKEEEPINNEEEVIIEEIPENDGALPKIPQYRRIGKKKKVAKKKVAKKKVAKKKRSKKKRSTAEQKVE